MRVEIAKDGLALYPEVGECPACQKGKIRMTTLRGELTSFECMPTVSFPHACGVKFYWTAGLNGQVHCQSENRDFTFKNQTHDLGRAILDTAKTPHLGKDVYDFGEITADGPRRFFDSHLFLK